MDAAPGTPSPYPTLTPPPTLAPTLTPTLTPTHPDLYLHRPSWTGRCARRLTHTHSHSHSHSHTHAYAHTHTQTLRQASDEGRGPLLDAEEKIVKCLGCDYLETTSGASEQQQHFMFCKKTGMPHDDNSEPGLEP